MDSLIIAIIKESMVVARNIRRGGNVVKLADEINNGACNSSQLVQAVIAAVAVAMVIITYQPQETIRHRRTHDTLANR